MFKLIYVKNFRKGRATNSSSTHSLIYRKDGEVFEDLNIFDCDYFGRHVSNIAATKEAKIKYIFHCIWWNDLLVRRMSMYYPQMKRWYHLAQKQAAKDKEHEAGKAAYEDIFGIYARGVFVSEREVNKTTDSDFSVDYLRFIIENEEIVIVGGSDEADFYYETTEGHEEAAMADDVNEWSSYVHKKNSINKNGNYYVAFGDLRNTGYRYSSPARLRFMTEKGEPIPEYPELIDLRITNKCEHGCKFCFMDSNMEEPHADISNLRRLAWELNKPTEFSIGGGNILLYPKLEDLFRTLNYYKHIINVTINVKDCKKILEDEKLKAIFDNYVDGIGVSVFKEEDVDEFITFKHAFERIGSYEDNRNAKYVVMHMVPEYLGLETSKKILSLSCHLSFPVLLLGYKENGRGANCVHHKFNEKEFRELTDSLAYRQVAIDTTFAKNYKEFIEKNFATKYCLTGSEGEYSMYIDGITMNAYKSSYELDKPYALKHEYGEPGISIKEAFNLIRIDNGFPVYEEKHYWDEKND